MMVEYNKNMAINPDRIILMKKNSKTGDIDIYCDLPSESNPYTVFTSKLTLKETMKILNPKKSTRELLKEISDI